jgi:hypothetical protein
VGGSGFTLGTPDPTVDGRMSLVGDAREVTDRTHESFHGVLAGRAAQNPHSFKCVERRSRLRQILRLLTHFSARKTAECHSARGVEFPERRSSAKKLPHRRV